ncbi:MAG: hypothetical protein HYY23_05820 [Verrucomicrobia bacterium]|nr:hypothetical protein [Verrucomicrobiota bacterium]
MNRLASLSGILLAQSLAAVIVTPLSIRELATRAELVVHGEVLKTSCQRDPAGRVYTRIELRVREAWKGTPATNPLILVHGGGIIGGERVEIPGQVEYAVGEEVVVFLVLNPRGEGVTVGLAQGKFHLWKDEGSGNLLVRNPFHGTGRNAAATHATASGEISFPFTLSALKALVAGIEK